METKGPGFRQVQNTGFRSLFYQYRSKPKHSLKLTLGVIRPKQEILGMFRFVSVLVKQRLVNETCEFVPAPVVSGHQSRLGVGTL